MKSRRTISAAIILGLALTVGSMSAAHADAPSAHPTPGQNSIQAPRPAKDGFVSTQATTWVNGTISGYVQKRVTPPGTAANDITVGFSSSVRFLALGTQATVSGTSYATWHGVSNASSIRLSDKIWATGVGLSVSVPAGAGFSVTNDSTTLSNTVSNTKTNKHQFSGVAFAGGLGSINQNSTGTLRFGTTTYFYTA